MGKGVDMGALVDIYGGEFRLTVIIQRRLRELVRGARPLVEVGRGRQDLVDIVLCELEEGRIEPTEEVSEPAGQDIFGIDEKATEQEESEQEESEQEESEQEEPEEEAEKEEEPEEEADA